MYYEAIADGSYFAKSKNGKKQGKSGQMNNKKSSSGSGGQNQNRSSGRSGGRGG